MGYSAISMGQDLSYAPTITGTASTPTMTMRYSLVGKLCVVTFTMTTVVSNATSKTLTFPFPAARNTVMLCGATQNAGTNDSVTARLDFAAGSNVVTITRGGNSAAWTASGNCFVYFTAAYIIQ